MTPSTSMWLPLRNWLVLIMVDQPFLEPNLDVLQEPKMRSGAEHDSDAGLCSAIIDLIVHDGGLPSLFRHVHDLST
jgi:hypothetical protein